MALKKQCGQGMGGKTKRLALAICNGANKCNNRQSFAVVDQAHRNQRL